MLERLVSSYCLGKTVWSPADPWSPGSSRTLALTPSVPAARVRLLPLGLFVPPAHLPVDVTSPAPGGLQVPSQPGLLGHLRLPCSSSPTTSPDLASLFLLNLLSFLSL